ncbi:P-loop containing nucleoside triphosphate hydrolase protein, partial [Baffinella frigidus]
VVLATNIAETSITIDDIVFVIDTGKAKEKTYDFVNSNDLAWTRATQEKTYDPVNKLASLLPAWVSKAAARQRRGRAGRAGVCFHLYPTTAHAQMNEYQLPEILRTPLEELCLQIKALNLGNIRSLLQLNRIKALNLGKIRPFLQRALEPPLELSVDNAISLLTSIGALTSDEQLTALGRHLAALPVDPRVGKMLLLGAVMQSLVGKMFLLGAGMQVFSSSLSSFFKECWKRAT